MKPVSTSTGCFESRLSRCIRQQSFSTTSARLESTSVEFGKPQKLSKNLNRDRQANREFYVDVLSSSATKRDARSYLSKYVYPKKANPRSVESQTIRNNVNLGRLYLQSSSRLPGSLASTYIDKRSSTVGEFGSSLRIAVAVIRSVSAVDDNTLRGVGRTFAQLSRLGLGCVVIVDEDFSGRSSIPKILTKQMERVVEAVATGGRAHAIRLDRILHCEDPRALQTASVDFTKLDKIYQNLEKGAIVVASPLACGQSGDVFDVGANRAALALIHAVRKAMPEESAMGKSSSSYQASEGVRNHSLERLIIIDPRGGLPHISRGGSHVFVNLEQEFEDIRHGLQMLSLKNQSDRLAGGEGGDKVYGDTDEEISSAAATLSAGDIQSHLDNLQLAREALRMLPPTSSALIVTPMAAAYSAVLPTNSNGIQSQRNPLIHNLLTDKPLFSSSLPRQRLSMFGTRDIPTNHPSMLHAPPTHLKHGMPISILPNPAMGAWLPPEQVTFSLSLEDPRIDQARLVALIEDSFGRHLNVSDYFSRVRPRLAGIIIAGDYEGGAILTWEQPRSFHTGMLAPAAGSPSRLVPYLDKFAVLRRAQGGGVADVVFSAMVRRCFPKGVCWRSRNGNPVNKWYFERSRGSFKLPLQADSNQAWTMFWTTEGLQPERFGDYVDVCLQIKSSWAD